VAHARAQTIARPASDRHFIQHFDDHHELLENALGRRFTPDPTGHREFLEAMTELVRDGRMRPAGIGSIKRGGEMLYVFEGSFVRTLRDGQRRTEQLVLLTRPNGEWVTLLRGGGVLPNLILEHLQVVF
jgi:hypothetical protein